MSEATSKKTIFAKIAECSSIRVVSHALAGLRVMSAKQVTLESTETVLHVNQDLEKTALNVLPEVAPSVHLKHLLVTGNALIAGSCLAVQTILVLRMDVTLVMRGTI